MMLVVANGSILRKIRDWWLGWCFLVKFKNYEPINFMLIYSICRLQLQHEALDAASDVLDEILTNVMCEDRCDMEGGEPKTNVDKNTSPVNGSEEAITSQMAGQDGIHSNELHTEEIGTDMTVIPESIAGTEMGKIIAALQKKQATVGLAKIEENKLNFMLELVKSDGFLELMKPPLEQATKKKTKTPRPKEKKIPVRKSSRQKTGRNLNVMPGEDKQEPYQQTNSVKDVEDGEAEDGESFTESMVFVMKPSLKPACEKKAKTPLPSTKEKIPVRKLSTQNTDRNLSVLPDEDKEEPCQQTYSEKDVEDGEVWDGESFTESMGFTEQEEYFIKSLPRVERPLFVERKGRIPTCKNPALMESLLFGSEAKDVLNLWNVTKEEYVGVTGKKLDDTSFDKSSNKENDQSLNKLGRDKSSELVKHANSSSYYSNLTWAYNKIAQFSKEVPELATFDWLKADPHKEVDGVLRFLLEWVQPRKDGCALGDRFTPEAFKVLKTGLQNVFNVVLKRSDLTLAKGPGSLVISMQAYKGKQAAYVESGQTVPAGTRARKLMVDQDMEKRDAWLNRPITELTPEELSTCVASYVLEATFIRGVSVLMKIDRNAFVINQFDESGKEYVLLNQAVRSKKQRGTGNGPFKPLIVRIYGDEEVKKIKFFLGKLPSVMCTEDKNCNEDKDCACSEWLLRAKDTAVWKFNDSSWYYRVPWGEDKIKKLNKRVSTLAGLSQTYTNSSARPTGITSMDRVGFNAAQISANSGHVDHNTMEKYKKWATLQNSRIRHEIAMISTASGREALRTEEPGNNLFGPISSKSATIYDKLRDLRSGGTVKVLKS